MFAKLKMKMKRKTHEKSEEVKISYVIFENVLIVLLIIFGFLGMLPLTINGLPIVSIVYVLFAVIMLIFVLRKHLCTNCYYYGKWCHSGWGKLASLMFKKNSGSWKFGIKLARFT